MVVDDLGGGGGGAVCFSFMFRLTFCAFNATTTGSSMATRDILLSVVLSLALRSAESGCL